MKKRKPSKDEVMVRDVIFSKDKKELIHYPVDKAGVFYYVPKSVETIQSGAFSGCHALEAILISDEVSRIEPGAFWDCPNLKNIMVSNRNSCYSSKEGRLYDEGGKKCLNDEIFLPAVDYVIPDNVKDVTGFEVYSMKKSSRCYEYWNSGRGELIAFGNVRTVTIPAGVEIINKNVFSAFTHLIQFKVAKENRHFKSIGGVLFSKDGKRLIAYPSARPGKEYKVPDGTQVIGEDAFKHCEKLEKVHLPESLNCIEQYAFFMSGIIELSLPDQVTEIGKGAFESCCRLNAVDLPKNIKVIGQSAFSYCDLKKIRLGSGLKMISEKTFNGNPLEDVDIGPGVEYIGEKAFFGCNMVKVIIPDNVKSIDNEAFAFCNCLKEVYIGSGLAVLHGLPFFECDNLASFAVSEKNPKYSGEDGILYNKVSDFLEIIPPKVKIPNRMLTERDGVLCYKDRIEKYPESKPDSVYTIPEDIYGSEQIAFEHCKYLKEIIIPKSWKKIPSYEFSSCTSLERITVPEGIYIINNSAFESCYHLKKVALPSTLTYIQNSAFAACWDLKEINLPDRLAEIGPNAFEECHSIETIRIPGSVKEISESAFKGCENLKTVIIENGVTTIGDNAFKECHSLQEIYIPDSVTEIGDNAFQECKALHTVRLPNNIELGTAVFKWCYTLANIQTQDKQHLLLKADMFDDGFDIDWDDDEGIPF